MFTLEMFFTCPSGSWTRAIEWALFSKYRKSLSDRWGRLKLGYSARLPHPFLYPAFVAWLEDSRLMDLANKRGLLQCHSCHFILNKVTPTHAYKPRGCRNFTLQAMRTLYLPLLQQGPPKCPSTRVIPAPSRGPCCVLLCDSIPLLTLSGTSPLCTGVLSNLLSK